jgi:hypothetical protein
MLELLLEENVCKDPAKPWISNRQIHVGFGTVLTTTLAPILEENRAEDPA